MADPIDINEWDYVASNGIEVIGKRAGPRKLSPVLTLLHPMVLPTMEGALFGIAIQAMPFLGVGLKGLEYPEGALVIHLSAFVGKEKNWAALIAQGLKTDVGMRMANLGIVRAPDRVQ